MAYVITKTNNSDIANLAGVGTGAKVWLGLFNDAWMWSDGRETSFRYWLSGAQIGGNCASVAAQQGRWLDANCHDKATFVCQGDLKVKKMVIRMKVRSDVDLTDSRVSDALLEELETSLKLQGVTDLNLSWRRDTNGTIFQSEQLVVPEKRGC